MTTLPQTTGIRLPRPVGGGGPPGTGMQLGHGGAPAAAAAAGLTAGDIWRVLRSNMWLIGIMVVAFGILGIAANWWLSKYHSRYTAFAYVQVEPRTNSNLLGRGTQDYQDWSGLMIEQRTQSTLLTGDALFSRVLTNPNAAIRQTTWFKKFVSPQKQADGSTREAPDVASAKADLMERFNATPVADSKVIRIEMSCSNPEDCRAIIENVVAQHLDEQQALSTNRSLDRTQNLNNLKSKYESRARELGDHQNNRMMQLNIGAIGSTGRYTATDLEMQAAIAKQIEVSSIANAAQGTYEALLQQIQSGQTPAAADEIVEHDMMVVNYRAQLVTLDIEIAATSDAGGLGTDSRQIRDLKIRRDRYQIELDKMRDEKRVQAVQSLLADAQSKAQSAKDSADTANKKIDQLKSVLGDLAIAMSDYLTITDELTSTREALKEVKDQLDTINSASAVSQVSWAQRPVKPDIPSFPKLPITLAVAIVLGLGLSLGVAFAREMMDTSVRSPRDIARVGQMNLLGMIPHEDDDPQSAGAPLPMVIFQAPTSIMAEQYRQVRTRLQHAASLDTTRSIVVTSPAPGDGKTTVACNLAAGLALNGRKILLVDANFRRPELNKVFGVPNDVGLSNALASLDNFEGAIRSTQIPNLDVMTTGQRPANPTELLESQLFTDFIERTLEEYDHVIFDTGPMLLVSETAAMAPRVDGVVSVVRAASNSRGLLGRLRDGLRQLKAEHLGVVLNGVRAQAGGYYNRNIKTYYEYQDGHAAN